MTELEVCVDTAEALAIAQAETLARIELCSALDLGGLTPSVGMMQLAADSPVPVYAMIRPRGGSFVFTDQEEKIMLADIQAARTAGLAGIVLGASQPDNRLNADMLQRLSAACGPLRRTLHRAFDLVPDPFEALETAIALGFDRILTSGCALDAVSGIPVLKALVHEAKGRLSIMAGSGVTHANAKMIVRQTGVQALHGSFRTSSRHSFPQNMTTRMGFGSISAPPSPEMIQDLRTALDP